MIIEPVILVVMGAGFVLAGWQGFRIPTHGGGSAGLGVTELRRRRLMVRGASYACLGSGAVLVLLAVVLTCALVGVLGAQRVF